jgi:hypothetical protein
MSDAPSPTQEHEGIAQPQTLPAAPRLQLRWIPYTDEPGPFQFNWQCIYELVLPLQEHDIRREVYEDGQEVGERSEIALEIGRTNCDREDGGPCILPNGALYFDAPFRDGSRALWDSKALGGLPIYAVSADGRYIQSPTNQARDGSSDQTGEAA